MVRLLSGLPLILLLVGLPAPGRERSPVILELFTSEGCSSCPAADEALARLERDQPIPNVQIVPLGFHVDYWNRLGWTDPYSSHSFSQRQEEYSEAFGGDRVYTPQMVVDGFREFVGGEPQALQAIAASAAQPKAILELAFSSRCGLSPELRVAVLSIPKASKNDAMELVLAITEAEITSQVRRGENAGRSLPHTAVVRQLRSLGEVKLAADQPFVTSTQLSAENAWKRRALKAVVFLQEKKSRRILGAAVQPFCECNLLSN